MRNQTFDMPRRDGTSGYWMLLCARVIAAWALPITALSLSGCGAGSAESRADHQPAVVDESAGPASRPGEPTLVKLASSVIVAAAGIEVASVELRPVRRNISCNGQVSFNENRYAQVRPRVDGIVRDIRVDVGAAVHAGDILAIVDSATLGDLKADYLLAVAKRDHWEEHKRRTKPLADGGAMAAKELIEAEHQLEQEQMNVTRTRQPLINLGFSRSQIDEMLTTKETGTELPIIAPQDGRVVRRRAVEGEAVERNRELFAIADLGLMWIHLNVYEADLPAIHLGQKVQFTADGLPGPALTGSVNWISPEVDPQTRSIHVRAEVANPGGILRANMFGKGQIEIEDPHDTLVVPQNAVQTHRDGPVVFVQRSDDTFEMRPVRIGAKDGQVWEVTQGVRRGEKVATTGSFLLKSDLEKEAFSDSD